MTREDAKSYLKDHPDERVREALDTLCLTASLDTVNITIAIDNEKREETVASLIGAGVLARVEQMRLAHRRRK